jgi:hypothetical protein
VLLLSFLGAKIEARVTIVAVFSFPVRICCADRDHVIVWRCNVERFNVRELDKLIKMTGARARLDAKAKDSYIVYYSNNVIIKELPNGTKTVIKDHDEKAK